MSSPARKRARYRAGGHKGRPYDIRLRGLHGVRRDAARLSALRFAGAITRPLIGRPVSKARRVLVIRPDHLGDLLFAGPALRTLRSSMPDADVTALVGPWGAPIASRLPAVNRTLVWDIPWFNRRPNRWPAEAWVSASRLAWLLSSQEFDQAIVLRFDFSWGALVSQMAGIPSRHGYSLPATRPFLTSAATYGGIRHEVERNVDLVAALPGVERPDRIPKLEFAVADSELRDARSLLRSHGIGPDDTLVIIHPGAGSRLKVWRQEGWAKVADELARATGVKVALTGGSGEVDLTSEVSCHASGQVVDLSGKTSLGTLAAVYRHASLVMGPDSGPLHLATAVGTPTVHLFGPVDERLFGPWGDPELHRVVRTSPPCAPCGRLDRCTAPAADRSCVMEIRVDDVVSAALSVLERR